jgi:hypothetical protein
MDLSEYLPIDAPPPEPLKLVRTPAMLGRDLPMRKYSYIIELPDGKIFRNTILINDNGVSLYDTEEGKARLRDIIRDKTPHPFRF